MPRYSDTPRCFYTGGRCGFPDDDESCVGCSKYSYINCEKCSLSVWGEFGGLSCSKNGRYIEARNLVCDHLKPNCFLCDNLVRKYNSYDNEYSCKLGKKLSHQGCDDGSFVPKPAYLEWREKHPEPKQ